MGICTSVGDLLVRAKQQDIHFGDLCTIGHQNLAIPLSRLQEMTKTLGITEPDWTNFASDGFADDFFKHILSTKSIRSIDYSDYQNADIVHDLNTPLPKEWIKHFDVLFDGGSIEHIFDIKQVLSNYMTSVKIGGNLILVTSANNLCGHGFYQFSPEFFYRVFSRENGYTVKEMALIETPLLSASTSRTSRVYQVPDPAKVGRRIQLVNNKPVLIYVHAQRISDCPPFESLPLQSDYRIQKWGTDTSKEKSHQPNPKLYHQISAWEQLQRRLRQIKKHTFHNKSLFKRLKL